MDRLQVTTLCVDERAIAYFAVARNDLVRVKIVQPIQDVQPVFPTRVRIGKAREKSVNHHIPREENAVFLDEYKIISLRMRRPKRRLTMFPASLRRFG